MQEICAKVVSATFAYLFVHRGVNGYANVAFTTFARIYSSFCTNLHQICAEQIWCKSIFSLTGRLLEISSNKAIATELIVLNARKYTRSV